jgi:hypothetical protein
LLTDFYQAIKSATQTANEIDDAILKQALGDL